MKTNQITIICISLIIISALILLNKRYVFLINSKNTIAIGDRWTGCVDYSEISYRDIDIAEITLKTEKEIEEFLNSPLSPEPKAVEYGNMIRSDC